MYGCWVRRLCLCRCLYHCSILWQVDTCHQMTACACMCTPGPVAWSGSAGAAVQGVRSVRRVGVAPVVLVVRAHMLLYRHVQGTRLSTPSRNLLLSGSACIQRSTYHEQRTPLHTHQSSPHPQPHSANASTPLDFNDPPELAAAASTSGNPPPAQSPRTAPPAAPAPPPPAPPLLVPRLPHPLPRSAPFPYSFSTRRPAEDLPPLPLPQAGNQQHPLCPRHSRHPASHQPLLPQTGNRHPLLLTRPPGEQGPPQCLQLPRCCARDRRAPWRVLLQAPCPGPL